MLDVFYKRRLKHDLEIWVERGWVGSAGAARILEEISTGDGRSRLPMVLGGIGVVCIALALAAFIASDVSFGQTSIVTSGATAPWASAAFALSEDATRWPRVAAACRRASAALAAPPQRSGEGNEAQLQLPPPVQLPSPAGADRGDHVDIVLSA